MNVCRLLTFLKKILSGTLSECQTVCSVGPDLGPNCLQRSAADDKIRGSQ